MLRDDIPSDIIALSARRASMEQETENKPLQLQGAGGYTHADHDVHNPDQTETERRAWWLAFDDFDLGPFEALPSAESKQRVVGHQEPRLGGINLLMHTGCWAKEALLLSLLAHATIEAVVGQRHTDGRGLLHFVMSGWRRKTTRAMLEAIAVFYTFDRWVAAMAEKARNFSFTPLDYGKRYSSKGLVVTLHEITEAKQHAAIPWSMRRHGARGACTRHLQDTVAVLLLIEERNGRYEESSHLWLPPELVLVICTFLSNEDWRMTPASKRHPKGWYGSWMSAPVQHAAQGQARTCPVGSIMGAHSQDDGHPHTEQATARIMATVCGAAKADASAAKDCTVQNRHRQQWQQWHQPDAGRAGGRRPNTRNSSPAQRAGHPFQGRGHGGRGPRGRLGRGGSKGGLDLSRGSSKAIRGSAIGRGLGGVDAGVASRARHTGHRGSTPDTARRQNLRTPTQQGGVCNFFARGCCTRGSACRFQHVHSSGSARDSGPPVAGARRAPNGRHGANQDAREDGGNQRGRGGSSNGRGRKEVHTPRSTATARIVWQSIPFVPGAAAHATAGQPSTALVGKARSRTKPSNGSE